MFQVLAALQEHPKHICFESQEDGEDIVFLIRRHWFTQIPRVLTIVLLGLLPLVYLQLVDSLNFIPAGYEMVALLMWYLMVIAFSLESFVSWYFNVFIVTPKRIVDIDFWALLYKNVSETAIDHVEDCSYTMGGIFQSIFNYGDVSLQTAAEKREFEFIGAPNPARVHDVITDLMHLAHHEPRIKE